MQRAAASLLLVVFMLCCASPQPTEAQESPAARAPAWAVVPIASSSDSAPLSGPDRANFVQSAFASCSATMQKNHAEVPAAQAKTFCTCLSNKEADVTTSADIAYIQANHTLSPEHLKRVEPLNEICKAQAGAAPAPAEAPPAAAGAALSGPDRVAFINSALASCRTEMQKSHPEVAAPAVDIYCNCMAVKEADTTTQADIAYITAHHEPAPEYRQRLEQLSPSCKATASAAAGTPSPATPGQGLAGADRDAYVGEYLTGCSASMQKENPGVSPAVTKSFCTCMANKGADTTTPAEFAEIRQHGTTPAQRKRMEPFAAACREAALAAAPAAPPPAPASSPLSAEQRTAFVSNTFDSCSSNLHKQHPNDPAETIKTFCTCLSEKSADMTSPDDVAYYREHHEMSPDYRRRTEAVSHGCEAEAKRGPAKR